MATLNAGAGGATPLRHLWREALRRQPTLTWFAVVMLAAMLPSAVALGLDARTVHGVNVWVKPLKFMSALALFALTTAWFMDLLPEAQRRRPLMRTAVGIIVVIGGAEVSYIVLQSVLGEASHYNLSDALHRTLYSLMGVGALLLMVTQLVLAVLIARHGRTDVPPLWRQAVVLGLVMTFVLGVAAAGPLGSAQPPAGAGLPVVGWHLGGGDLRPAHFLGSHAEQFVPLVAWALLTLRLRHSVARTSVMVFAAAYTALWVAAMVTGLSGAQWIKVY